MFCTACGAAASAEDRFCRRCGRGLQGEASSAPAPAPRIITAAPEPARPRRNILGTGLRVLSLLGMVPSLVGAWMLLQEPSGADAAAPVRPVVTTSPEPDGSSPSGLPSPSSLPSPSPSEEPPVEPAALTCSSPFLGYTVSYPSSLVTLDSPSRHACRYFHTEPFEVPSSSDLPPTQIRIYPSTKGYSFFDRMFDPETNADLISRRNLEVGGYAAMRIELTTHGDEGNSTLYAYVVDAGGQVIVLDTWEGFDPDFAQAKVNLDSVATALEFPSGGTS